MNKNAKPSRSSRLDTSRVNTLGSQAKNLNDLLDELDRAPGTRSSKRNHARLPFRAQAIATTIRQADGGEVHLRLACRNLSIGGMSLLHSAYLHPGTSVAVELPLAVGGARMVKGKVIRCAHVRGMIHEVGVRFGEQINLRDFQRSDPFGMEFSYENVKPCDLKGLVVHLDPSEIDRKIVRHILRDTSLSIRGCETAAEARELIEKGCDLIIMEYGLTDTDGAVLTSSLRCEGQMHPVIMVSSNTTPEAAEMIRRSAVEVFLPKPIDPDRLMSAIAEFLLPTGRVREPSGSDSEAMKELAALFSKDLVAYADRLESALSEQSSEGVLQIAQQIRGTALSLGFGQLGAMSGEVADRLGRKQPLSAMVRQVRGLITSCRSPRPVS